MRAPEHTSAGTGAAPGEAGAPRGASASAVMDELERIEDPCSIASGAPAGLVSMGLVREVDVKGPPDAARVEVTLCITEPGCLMGSVFKKTAEERLAALPGVESVGVEVDHGYVWDPSDMTPAYRERLAQIRAARRERMKERLEASTEGAPRSGASNDPRRPFR